MSGTPAREKNTEKRGDVRVVFRRTVTLGYQDEILEGIKVSNLSVSGLYLQGCFQLSPGTDCHLKFFETGRHATLILKMSARVVRVEEEGMALVFTDMGPDSYMFLQTMVLYYTEDPVGVAREFLEDYPASSRRSLHDFFR